MMMTASYFLGFEEQENHPTVTSPELNVTLRISANLFLVSSVASKVDFEREIQRLSSSVRGNEAGYLC